MPDAHSPAPRDELVLFITVFCFVRVLNNYNYLGKNFILFFSHQMLKTAATKSSCLTPPTPLPSLSCTKMLECTWWAGRSRKGNDPSFQQRSPGSLHSRFICGSSRGGRKLEGLGGITSMLWLCHLHSWDVWGQHMASALHPWQSSLSLPGRTGKPGDIALRMGCG